MRSGHELFNFEESRRTKPEAVQFLSFIVTKHFEWKWQGLFDSLDRE
jgi:hypothetical protein